MKTILSVDAGGTKTRGVLLAEDNRILAEAVTGCGNTTLDFVEARKNIAEAIRRCMPEEKPEGIVVGAAGAGSGTYAADLTEYLKKQFAMPVQVTSDGPLAVYGALGEKDGILVISGTGSVIQGKKNGVLERCGGWGHLLGEYGSGANIGYKLLTVLVQCLDLGQAVPALENAVYASLHVSDWREMVAYVYSHPKADIAKLAAVADTLAQTGEGHAKAVLTTEAHALAGWTAGLYRRMGFTTEEIRTVGGCFGNLVYFREKFALFLQEMLPEAVLCMDPFDPVLGAWPYWRQAVSASV
ncbi:MAG: hypothetical protein E7631_01890 [Ruminococcaceae bacterium]|nr:hypothetical protein [Oscillospiraceae bacterium]